MSGRCQWLMPAVLATWEAEIERISVLGQSRTKKKKKKLMKPYLSKKNRVGCGSEPAIPSMVGNLK
jgi:hypothetical protein